METRLLLLCLWIISTFVIAKDLSKEENEERLKKCGFTMSNAEPNPFVKKGDYWETRISKRHTVANPNLIPNFDYVECRRGKDLKGHFDRAVKATFVGDCNGLRGIVLVEYNNENYKWYACLPHRELNIGDHVIAYNKDQNPHHAQVQICSTQPQDHLCIDKEIPEFRFKGGPVVVKTDYQNMDHYRLYGTGFWNKSDQSVAVSIFHNLDGICSDSGICPEPVATTTETPIITTTEEVVTTTELITIPTSSSTEPPAPSSTIPTDSPDTTVELASPPDSTTPEPVTVPDTTTIETSTRKVTRRRRKTTTAPRVKDTEEDITKGCGDEYLCWEGDLFGAAGSLSLLIAIIVVLIAFY